MLLLASINDKLQIITGATATVGVHASYIDYNGTVVTPGRRNTAITTATTTDVVLAPGASTTRNIKEMVIRNKDVVSVTITVVHTDGTTAIELYKYVLAPEDQLEYADGAGFYLRQAPLPVVSPNFSSADQSLTAAAANYLTGSLISLPRTAKIGTVFRWTISVGKTAAGVATSSFDIRFGTAGAVGDTSRCATGALDTETAIADEMVVQIIAIVRGPIGASCVVQSIFDIGDNLTTTGWSNTARKAQVKAIQSAAFDITTVTKVGVSMTPGTADVATARMVLAEVFNP